MGEIKIRAKCPLCKKEIESLDGVIIYRGQAYHEACFEFKKDELSLEELDAYIAMLMERDQIEQMMAQRGPVTEETKKMIESSLKWVKKGEKYKEIKKKKKKPKHGESTDYKKGKGEK
jgi:hypothetical protein